MSRAFVKEADGMQAYDDLPDRPIDLEHNLVTAHGLDLIEAETVRLREELIAAREAENRDIIAELSRDLRYWTARRATAEVVPPPTDTETVRFGCRVTIERNDGRRQSFRIVGIDEADPTRGRLSYVSPLAQALIGKSVGDVVPARPGEAEIVAIDTTSDSAD